MTDTQRARELLACPFCGGQARVSVLLSGPFVFCIICHGETSCHKTEDEAVAAWNTRATLPGREGIEAARAKMRMIVSHATGGSSQDIDAPTNDICVRISRHVSRVYEGGKESAIRALNSGAGR